MADTTTPLLGLLLMGTGGDNNAWGTNLNNQVITLLENAIAGVTSLSISGGSHTLTAAESRSATIELSGTLTASQILIVPATAKKWTFINQCVLSGFEVQVKTASGVLRNLPGGWTEILSDGTGALSRQDGHLVGEFFYSAAATVPSHALECNGALASRVLYGDLFAKIGTTWGVGDSFTTFGLPNGEDTGRYLRSKSSALSYAVGTYQANQFTAHTHAFTGALSAGTLGTDVQGAHTHSTTESPHAHSVNMVPNIGTASAPAVGGSGSVSQVGTSGAVTGLTINSAGAHQHNITGAPGIGTLANASAGSGTETRPESIVGLLCIRY